MTGPRRSRTRGHRARTLAALAALLPSFACATVPWPYPSREPASPVGGRLDLRGVVHVHTNDSHDSPGTLDQVVRAARAAGVSWVALTEHTRPGRVRGPLTVDGVTVLPGFEFHLGGGSILALGVPSRPHGRLDPPTLVEWIHAAGGAAFLGHAERWVANRAALADADLDGVEVQNLHASARSRAWGLLLRAFFLPRPLAMRHLLAPSPAPLELLESLPGARGVVGGVDAHARFRLFGRAGGTFDRYEDVFRLLTTHVWVDEPGPQALVGALRAGDSYVAFEGLGEVAHFGFRKVSDGFELEAPRPARLVLRCDGAEAAAALAAHAVLAIPPGARRCRAEAWLEEALWIVTSFRSIDAAGAAR